MTAYEKLALLDPEMAPVLAATGRPDPFTWPDHGRTGGDLFAAMVMHISGQQISTVMAFRLYDGLTVELGGIPAAEGGPFGDLDAVPDLRGRRPLAQPGPPMSFGAVAGLPARTR